jgi:hypothetical protein
LKTADEIEELLIEEMRRLGNSTKTEWAISSRAARGAGTQGVTAMCSTPGSKKQAPLGCEVMPMISLNSASSEPTANGNLYGIDLTRN